MNTINKTESNTSNQLLINKLIDMSSHNGNRYSLEDIEKYIITNKDEILKFGQLELEKLLITVGEEIENCTAYNSDYNFLLL